MIKNQYKIILDGLSSKYKLIPWILVKCFKKLKQLMIKDNNYSKYICLSFYNINNQILLDLFGEWNKQKEE